MHGPPRQLLLYAKPWQRVVLGVALLAIGLVTGATILPALGAFLVVVTVFGEVRRRRPSSPEPGEVEAGGELTDRSCSWSGRSPMPLLG
ncbi:MAG: hypothetical protein ACYCST_11750 [Acidimicrobiales bacterium]